MTTFHDFLCRTPHVYIYPCDSISFDDLRGFTEHFWVFPEDLDDERVFARIMCECFLLEIFRVDESICRVEFRKNHHLRRYLLHDLAVGTIAVTVHRSECDDRSCFSEIFPEVFVHRRFISRKIEKSNLFSL